MSDRLIQFANHKEDAVRKVFLYMTMTLDGFVAGPNNELDWMLRTPDPEMNKDSVDLFMGIDAGFMGYPTASGMIPYWSNVIKNRSASKEELEIARAVNRLHSIIISNKEEQLEWEK